MASLEREFSWRVKWDSSDDEVVLTTKEVAAVDTGSIEVNSPALLPEVRAMARAAQEGGKRMVGLRGWQCWDERYAAKFQAEIAACFSKPVDLRPGGCAGGCAGMETLQDKRLQVLSVRSAISLEPVA